MARSAPLLVAMTMSLVGCAFDWASLDPRVEQGAGGSGATGGGVTGGAGQGGGSTTSSTGGTTSTGGSTSDGGAGGVGGSGGGGTGGSGGAPPLQCNGAAVPILNNGQAIMGSTLQAPADFEGSCAATTGGEIIYAFELPATNDVLVDTTLPGTNYDTVLHVRVDSCEDSNNEVGCLDRGNGDDLMLLGLPAGTYFVIVDSHTISNEGNFELMVSW